MNLLLIGCGNIGKALLHLWAPLNNLFERIVVVQPSMSHANNFINSHSIEFVNSINSVAENFLADLIILAIKPQTIGEVMPELVQRIDNSIIVSMLAGINLAQLSSFLPNQSRVVRLMPNIAIKTGQSINLFFSKKNLVAQDVNIIESAFKPSGMIFWLDKESDIDILTPISGSGPAYFFLLSEILLAETIKFGIDENIACKLVQQIFLGSASLVEKNNNFQNLTSSVASKKGVTEEALKVLKPNIEQAMEKALKAALKRSKELSNENCY
ncbi:pyrroline-5-carboxylate reductase [Wolbachia endosymbiont of Chironomus riparius]|uniref:pyrroline-5-carboxylate reductase n=1 Tax=Wolbachia endosymbiont of Chironomus riparius TaxID=2883238 RepID=UPI0020A10CEC|nr:pyrroline-5-carboxylate reductase [Wolbachia endosymbiont of Chironomus riparius]